MKTLDNLSSELPLPAQTRAIVLVVDDEGAVMPRLNGVELMQALASTHPDLPVILMSGYATTAVLSLRETIPAVGIQRPEAP